MSLTRPEPNEAQTKLINERHQIRAYVTGNTDVSQDKGITTGEHQKQRMKPVLDDQLHAYAQTVNMTSEAFPPRPGSSSDTP